MKGNFQNFEQMMRENVQFPYFMIHEQMIPCIKNQDPLLKSIFTPDNIFTLLSYLNQEHPLQSDSELSYQLPHAALEIITCECHILTELLFTHQYQPQSLLLDFLLQFLDYREHYLLAAYFSKTMISISKRVFSADHKFNPIICSKVFNHHGLIKCLNHLYSASTNELIIRWITLKGKNNDFQKEKQQFMVKLVGIFNEDEEALKDVKNLTPQSEETGIILILQMLKSPLQPPPPQPQPMQHKNLNLMLNKNAQTQLYGLVCNNQILHEILKPIPQPKISKLNLVRKILQKLRIENEQLELKEGYNGQYLGQCITFQMLTQCLEWINQYILDLVTKYWNQNSQTFDNNFPKVNLLHSLDLLYQLHRLPELVEPLAYYYEEKETEHVQVLVKLLKLKNNIVQNSLTKIIMIVLNKLKCPDFARTLLHEGISKLIDEQGIREHIIDWAKIILHSKAEQGHIYENITEEAKWEHMTETIETAEQIQIGNFRFKPCNLPIFYSANKAKEVYANFLKQPILIEYDSKTLQTLKLKKNISCPSKINEEKVVKNEEKMKNLHKEDQQEVIEVDWIRTGYLNYELQSLIDQL